MPIRAFGGFAVMTAIGVSGTWGTVGDRWVGEADEVGIRWRTRSSESERPSGAGAPQE